tara:strand:+ start:921 stop:1184 length:264 start_codon:yes stop_codon:yes gene_type:complete
MPTETKLVKTEVKEPYKIIQAAYDIITTDDSGVVIDVKRYRNTFVPVDDVSGEDQQIKDLATANWTDDIKTSYLAKVKNITDNSGIS